MNNPTAIKNAIALAEEHVHASEEALVEQCAAEHTVANMGMYIEELLEYALLDRPQNLFYSAFNNLYQQSESDEIADGTMAEYKSWLKQAKKDVARVKKAKLPLTFKNVRMAFDNEGPFAKKK